MKRVWVAVAAAAVVGFTAVPRHGEADPPRPAAARVVYVGLPPEGSYHRPPLCKPNQLRRGVVGPVDPDQVLPDGMFRYTACRVA